MKLPRFVVRCDPAMVFRTRRATRALSLPSRIINNDIVSTFNAYSQVNFVKGKVDEPEFVDAIVAAKPDAIIHLAG